ncbi:MAG: SRPBCC domain-containing protein [Actinomycetota bacterium]|nr:SRPBCC domain-containing protein [Actinomycetota bacterium]
MARKFEVRKEVALDATPEQVWEAIATGPGLAAWFMPMEIDPDSNMVVAWEPGKRLTIETPPAGDGSTQAFEYLIEARGEGTSILRFVHSGFGGDDWDDEYESMMGMGWDMYLHTLAQYLVHFAGRRAVYVEAEGPPASARQDSWPLLAGALGVAEPVEPGAAVRFELPGAGPIDGVVDYVTERFVGLRTADALIRFHGRAPIGMTVAVSHHAYREEFDAAAATRAWETWLAAVFG